MRIVIDGYNLIRQVPELADLDRMDLEVGRDHLIRELSGYRAGKGHRITVVFDGGGSYHPGRRGQKVLGVTVIYSGGGGTADDVVASLCRDGNADLVVTADRELWNRADSEGVPVIAPRDFWGRVEAEKYLKLKGLDEEEDDENGGPARPRRKLAKKERKRKNLLERL